MLSSSEPHIVIRFTSNSVKNRWYLHNVKNCKLLVMFFRYDVLRVL
jgi:hypothetical protein